MKKYLPVFLVFVGVIVLLGVLFLLPKKKTPTVVAPEPTIAPLSVKEMPYINLIPSADGHQFKLMVDKITGAKTLEYELVYLVGDLQRGVIGSLEISSLPVSKDMLLGSCSKNVCKYDEGVNDGILTIKLRGNGIQKYELPFKLQNLSSAKNGLVSQDNKFVFKGKLEKNNYYVTLSTGGIPNPPTGEIVSGPYGVFTSGSPDIKGVIKWNLDNPVDGVKILAWDNNSKKWEEAVKNLKVVGNSISVDVDHITTFVAVK